MIGWKRRRSSRCSSAVGCQRFPQARNPRLHFRQPRPLVTFPEGIDTFAAKLLQALVEVLADFVTILNIGVGKRLNGSMESQRSTMTWSEQAQPHGDEVSN